MYKVLVLYQTPDDPQHFKDYYLGTHLPLAKQLPGLEACRYTYDVRSPMGGDAPFFCIWEGQFADEAAFGAAMQSEAGAKVAGDAENYATGGYTLVHYPLEDFA